MMLQTRDSPSALHLTAQSSPTHTHTHTDGTPGNVWITPKRLITPKREDNKDTARKSAKYKEAPRDIELSTQKCQ